MAWVEASSLRGQRSRVYQDSATGQTQWVGGLGALHYESTLDSGVFDTPVDATAVRINNAQLDGWLVSNNGWQYAIGQPGNKPTDGWVGFGGRRGQNWFRFRLARIGYLHWSDRAWQDVGGAPAYVRARLTRTANAGLFGPTNDPLTASSQAQWAGIWSTPGGGDVTARWHVDGDGLKEEVVINQAGREWIVANRPPNTPAAETWFGLVFQTDWADVPATLRGGQAQNTTTGDFDDAGGPVELRDALNRLLAFLPIDSVLAGTPSKGNPSDAAPLQKRFWKDPDSNTYLLVGVRCDVLNGLRAGPLVFDPTITVAATADDAQSSSNSVQSGGTGGVTSGGISSTLLSPGAHTGSDVYYVGARFLSVAVANAATIASATFSMKAQGTYSSPGTIKHIVHGHAADNPITFSTTTGNLSTTNRPRTTAVSASWDQKTVVAGTRYSIDVTTVIQELVNRAGWASGNAMVMIVEEDGTTTNGEWQDYYAWDDATDRTNNPPQLAITVGGGTLPPGLGPALHMEPTQMMPVGW